MEEKKITEREENLTKSVVILDSNFEFGMDFQWYFPQNNCKEVITKLQINESEKNLEKKIKKGKTRKLGAIHTKHH